MIKILLEEDIKNVDGLERFIDMNVLLEDIKSKHKIVLGAYDGKIVGVICLERLKMIEYLYVNKNCRHRGIGSALLEQALYLVNEKIYAKTCDEDRAFYIHHGFSFEDDCWMSYKYKGEGKFKDYQQVLDFVNSQKSRVYSLNNFQRFMNDLCCPQKALKVIHIGGTNGKGSTTNYVRSVLQEAGYQVATMTSPALTTRLDVIRVNDIHISEEEVLKYANRYMNMWLDYELSMFEIEVFIAIMYFIKEEVDFAVFEVGLGGELDATNIVEPIITANTNIGLDHMDYLGNTYEKIAKAKGGIIKKHIPFITGEKRVSCLEVFEKICKNQESQLIRVEGIKNIQEHDGFITYDFQGRHIRLDTMAMYQCDNSALAISILDYLKEMRYASFDDEILLKGIQNAKWAGRFEVMCNHPLIIIDGAHNKEGMQAFYHSAKYFQNIKIIFSALKDKDTDGMIETLLSLSDDVTVCEFDFERSQKASLLAKDYPVKIVEDWHAALDEAFLHEGTVFITGSLYFISQVRPYLMKKVEEMKMF